MKNKLHSFFRQIWLFAKIELKSLRLTGLGMTMISLGIPFGVILVVLLIAGGATPELGRLYIGGGVALITCNLCLVTLAQRLIDLRAGGGVEFYSSLPVSPVSLNMGNLLAYFLLVIPMIITFILLSSLIFKLDVTVSWWLLLVILLSALSFMSIGAIVGLYIKNYHRARNVSTILMFFVMFGTPIFWPAKALPKTGQIFERLLPFIYAAEGIREALILPVDLDKMIMEISGLLIFTIIGLFLTFRLNMFQER